nr:sortase [Salsipaludibacter albus]
MVLVAVGVVIVLFIVYLLFWTDREYAADQAVLTRQWDEVILPEAAVESGPTSTSDVANIPPQTEALPASTGSSGDATATSDTSDTGTGIAVPGDPGGSYALLWFERDGQFVVDDEINAVVEGVTLDFLARGPGHYPETSPPGGEGTFAVAGHRTTYGHPFHNLDLLEPGDEIHVVDLDGRHWIYDFVELRAVAPTDVWVVDPDPLNREITHGITLTTCHPKYSAAQRLVAFGELRVGDAATAAGADE